MKVSDFDAVLVRHVKTTIIPKMQNPFKIFAVGGMIGAGLLSAENMRPELEKVKILEGDEINTEKLRDFLRGGFEVSPIVPIWGMNFDKSDAESLMRAFGLSWMD